MAKGKSEEKCGCSPGMGIVALILGVVGLYSVILGIKTQWMTDLVFSNWMAMVYYLVGIVVMAMAKLSKYHAFCKCDMHKM